MKRTAKKVRIEIGLDAETQEVIEIAIPKGGVDLTDRVLARTVLEVVTDGYEEGENGKKIPGSNVKYINAD